MTFSLLCHSNILEQVFFIFWPYNYLYILFQNSKLKNRKTSLSGKLAKDDVSLTSADSTDSASATLMSSHAMKMGLYSINLGTKLGQRLHAAHMLILPLIPVFILLAQNGTNCATYILEAEEILSVQGQVLMLLYNMHFECYTLIHFI